MTNWSSSTIELIGKYSEAGCVSESGVDYGCVVEAYGGGLNEIHTEISDANENMSVAQNNVMSMLTFGLGMVKQEINSGAQNE